MIVQWCIKGLQLDDDAAARRIIDAKDGLFCNSGRNNGGVVVSSIADMLTPAKLDLHVNHFLADDPTTGRPVGPDSAFISLSCGTVERDVAAQTNTVHRARRTALQFGLNFGRRDCAYLFVCWVVLAPRRATEIMGVAEEVRDLTTYRRYSSYQLQGEVTAKILVPSSQVKGYQKWEWNRPGRRFHMTDWYPNPTFVAPETLSNVRDFL
jgi:hypothetical protein